MNKKISLWMKPFIPAKPSQASINLSIGISNYLNSKRAYLYKQIKQLSLQQLVGTRNSELENKLKDAIRKFLNISAKITNNNFIFGFGSYSILEKLAWKFLPKGLMVGEFPQFRFFPMEYILAGGKYQGFWKKDFSFPSAEITKAIKQEKKLKVIYINNPNNPTGKVESKNRLLKIISKSEEKNIFVIVDEVYGDLLPASSSLSGYVNKYQNLIVLRSFSKIFGLQNLRVGYMIACQPIINQYKDVCNWNEINNIGAILGLAVLKDQKYIPVLKSECLSIKKLTIKLLKKCGFSPVSGSPLVPLILFKSKKDIDLGEYFRQKNIKVEGTSKYQVLNSSFPGNFARIRIPASKANYQRLKQKLCI